MGRLARLASTEVVLTMKFRRLPIAAAGVAMLCVTPALAETITVEEAVALALDRGVEVQRAAGEVAAARGRLSGASVLLRDNPEVGAEAGRRTGSSTDLGFSVSQPVEIGGQRGGIGPAREPFLAQQRQLQRRQTPSWQEPP